MDGILRKFDYERGYGWVQLLRGRPDEPLVYCHAKAIKGGCEGIPLGSRLKFDLVEGIDGKLQVARARLVSAGETTATVKPFVRRAELRAQRALSEANGGGGMVA